MTTSANQSAKASAPGTCSRWLRRVLPLVGIIALMALAYGLGLHHHLSFEPLVRHRAAIGHFIAARPAAAIASFVTLYIVVVGLSLPGATVLSVASGFLFGAVIGGIASWAGALAGATVIFLVARSACAELLVRRAGPSLARLSEGFQADAFSYLLFLRLVPFPFWLVNLAPALFGVPLRTFVAATAIGIIPGTAAFVIFGAGLGSVLAAEEAQYSTCIASGRHDCTVDFDLSNVLTPTMLVSLVALGALALIPVIARRIWGRRVAADVASK